MKFPDPDAYISVRTRSGDVISGYVYPGHVWADERVLCLTHRMDTQRDGENLYHYISVKEIESWSWDCIP